MDQPAKLTRPWPPTWHPVNRPASIDPRMERPALDGSISGAAREHPLRSPRPTSSIGPSADPSQGHRSAADAEGPRWCCRGPPAERCGPKPRIQLLVRGYGAVQAMLLVVGAGGEVERRRRTGCG